jgi:DNA-binding MarR family transcriptional regulator
MESSIIDIERNRCNCSALRKASRRLSQMYDAALAPSGLRSTQYAILAEIDHFQRKLPTIGELAEAMVMDTSTIGQNLRPLERAGLLKLQQNEVDRRRKCVKLTRKGKARLAAAFPLWTDVQGRFEGKFGKRRSNDLRGILLGIAREPSFVGSQDSPEAAGAKTTL